jgi:hypothetical protein
VVRSLCGSHCVGLLVVATHTAAAQSTANSKPEQGSKPTSSSSKPTSSSSSSSSSDNPLLTTGPFTQYDRIKAEHVVPAVTQLLEEEGAALSLLEGDLTAAGKDMSYERVFRPYTQIRYRLDGLLGVVDHLQVWCEGVGGCAACV